MGEPSPPTLENLLRVGRDTLARAAVETADLDARLLVEHFTGTTRAHAIIAPRRPIDGAAADAAMRAFERRAAGEPVHRIIGLRAFRGIDLSLSPHTLEPRPDTETLVDEMLPFVRDVARRKGVCRIVDLGTGTGAIALALIAEEGAAIATGLDISPGALETASENAERLGLGQRFTTLHSDWFANLDGRYDAIVANPPYIRTDDIAGLMREVREHEPVAALDGGSDGLEAYRRIAADAGAFLAEGGRIGLEIGFDQKQAVIALFEAKGFVLVGSAKDLGERDRALVFAVTPKGVDPNNAAEILLGIPDECG